MCLISFILVSLGGHWGEGASPPTEKANKCATACQANSILTAISIIISIVFFVWLRNSTRFLMQILASLVIGGALGNAIDRLLYGAVADFINVTCCGIRNPYSFNLADVFIFVGLIGLLIFKFDEKQN